MLTQDQCSLVRSLKTPGGPDREISIIGERKCHIANLCPIDSIVANDDAIIEALTEWRHKYADCFMSVFYPSKEKTKCWLQNTLIVADDRLMFMIGGRDGTFLGQIGQPWI